MAVMIRYRIDAAPTARPVSMSIGCADDASCAGTLDVTAMLKAAKPAEWRSVKIKLSCFQAAGAKMDHVTAPFAVSTRRAVLAVADRGAPGLQRGRRDLPEIRDGAWSSSFQAGMAGKTSP
jgi:hypothetical protein